MLLVLTTISSRLMSWSTIISPVVIVAANKLFDTLTSLLGINTCPVPLARKSKSLSPTVGVITWPSINISANCAALSTKIFPDWVKLPV
jgi:hypothetical protein